MKHPKSNFFTSTLKAEPVFNLNKIKDSVFNYSLPILCHIFGASESGKTALALNIIKDNPDKTFIYVDTYYSSQVNPNTLSNNSFVMKSNRFSDIINILDNIDKDTCDYLIIDSFSNLYFEEESMKDNSFIYFNNAIKNIIDKAFKKNISILLLNTINGQGKPYNHCKELSKNERIEMQIISTDDRSIELEIIKGKTLLGYKNIHYELEV